MVTGVSAKLGWRCSRLSGRRYARTKAAVVFNHCGKVAGRLRSNEHCRPSAKLKLRADKAEGYAIHDTRLCKRLCGSTAFELEADRDEGCAQRTSGLPHKAYHLRQFRLYCRGPARELLVHRMPCDSCNLGVGVSLYEPEAGKSPTCARSRSTSAARTARSTARSWGSIVDWEVGLGQSHQLLDQA
jgi:hypothetical protein